MTFGAVALKDGDHPWFGLVDRPEARFGQRRGHAGAADRQHRRVRWEERGDVGGAGLGAGDDVRRTDREPEAEELVRDVLRRQGGVVGGVDDRYP